MLLKKSFCFSMSGREREHERGKKLGLHPSVRPHSGQAEQEMLGRDSVLWLEERKEHQSPWCAAALSLWVHCWPARFVITQRTKQKNSTSLWWWKDDGVQVNGGTEVMERAAAEVKKAFLSSHMERGMGFFSTRLCNNRSSGYFSWHCRPSAQQQEDPHRCLFKKLMTPYWLMERGFQVHAYQGYS